MTASQPCEKAVALLRGERAYSKAPLTGAVLI